MTALDWIVLAGLLLVAAGTGLIYLPAGVIVAGLEAVLIGVGARLGSRK